MGLEERIEEVASGPKKVSGDEGSVEQLSIDDLIKADRHLSSKRAVSGTRLAGVKFFKIQPPGSI